MLLTTTIKLTLNYTVRESESTYVSEYPWTCGTGHWHTTPGGRRTRCTTRGRTLYLYFERRVVRVMGLGVCYPQGVLYRWWSCSMWVVHLTPLVLRFTSSLRDTVTVVSQFHVTGFYTVQCIRVETSDPGPETVPTCHQDHWPFPRTSLTDRPWISWSLDPVITTDPSHSSPPGPPRTLRYLNLSPGDSWVGNFRPSTVLRLDMYSVP